jgi:excisionase family DNA binding protein
MGKRYVNSREAAKYLGTSEGSLVNLCHRGDGPPHVRLKRKILFEKADLKAWLAMQMSTVLKGGGSDER